ncbi:hypothetical protein JTB14_018110 [Gonioctena quinquepunctata]|nr:hypothetical protein JTB14_018110 [Gonioctena quinquepunctata]
MYVMLNIVFVISFIWSATAYIDPSTLEGKLGDHAKKTHDFCVDVTGATEEEIQQIRLGNFPEDEWVKRYAFCTRRATEMDTNLGINYDVVLDLYPERATDKDFNEMAGRCLDEGRNSEFNEKYEKNYVMEKCFYEGNPEIYLLF